MTKLDEVTRIYQTTNLNEVNDYLGKGYRIIKIFSTKKTKGIEEVIEPCYILGLMKE